MNNFFFTFFTIIISFFANLAVASTANYCQYYPHWSDCASNPKLEQLETFINQYKANAADYTVGFDWDGTLYDEKIPIKENGRLLNRSGQSVWHIWGADQLAKHDASMSYLFPSFKQINPDGKGINYQAWSSNIKYLDNYVEGAFKSYRQDRAGLVRTVNLPGSTYDKFSQIASFEVGMTFRQIRQGTRGYLAQYPASHYAFLKMFDIVHRLASLGFHVWILTGSSPYFIANVITNGEHSINGINQLGYTVLPACQRYMNKTSKDLAELTPDQFFAACTIAGNADDWPGGNAPIARHYDRRNFDQLSSEYAMAIDGYSRLLA